MANRTEYQRQYRKRNKQKLNDYRRVWIKRKRLLDEKYRLREYLCNRIRYKKKYALRLNTTVKRKKYPDDLSDLIPII